MISLSRQHYLVFKDSKRLSEKEIEKVKVIQRGLGIDDDGYLGAFTLDIMQRVFGEPKLPYTMEAYNTVLMYGKAENMEVLEPKGQSVKHFTNSFSGSFSYQKKPISITVNDGNVINETSCHYWLNKPESVLYFDGDTIRLERVKTSSELKYKPIWGIGGLGLIKDGKSSYFDADSEGFSGKYSDVLRKTNHNVLFEDKWGYVCLAYFKNRSTRDIISILEKLGAINAIQLDGGSWASCNLKKYKHNTSHVQYSMLRMKEVQDGC